MSKQIVITQNDSGISLTFNITENDKPYDLSDKNVKSMIVFPDETKQLIELDILDNVNGKVELLLTKELTEQSGLYKLFIAVYDNDDRVTAQKMVVYYVLEEYGGVK